MGRILELKKSSGARLGNFQRKLYGSGGRAELSPKTTLASYLETKKHNRDWEEVINPIE